MRTTIDKPKCSQDAQISILNKMYVSAVNNRLRELGNPQENDLKRWVWELIQNAKDTIKDDSKKDGVDIQINIKGDTVEFQHNGAPFTAETRLGLLYKYSDGKENHETTGRFGTGFLTTHCLSKTVSIESDMYGDNGLVGFSVTMFRDGQSSEELIEGLKKMEKSEEFYTETFGHTKYTYHVTTESGRRAIKLGVENLYENIAQTMLFCKELLSVRLDDNSNVTTIARLPLSHIGYGIDLAEFLIDVDGEKKTRRFLVTHYSEHNDEITRLYKKERALRIDAAIEIDKYNNVIDHKGKTSFFCVLPLVGIETQLNEPLIVNSPDFEPGTERQWLLLRGENRNEENGMVTTVGVNQIIYGKLVPMYEKLVQYLVQNKYGKLYLLANGLKKAQDHPQLDAKWYTENVISKYREILLRYPVVKPQAGTEYKKLSDCIIVTEPKEEDEKSLLRLLASLYPDKLAEENHAWAQYAWKDGADIWKTEDLCKDIEKRRNWQSIPVTLQDGQSLPGWYNQFLHHIVQYNELLLKEHALLPNMNGDLLKRGPNDFKQGENVTPFIIKLLDKLGKDVKPLLLNDKITEVTLDSKYNSQSYSADVNHLAKGIIDDGTPEKLSRLLPLLQIVPTDKEKYQVEFLDRRTGFLSITKDLYSLQNAISTEDDNLLEGAWKEVDTWFVTTVLTTLKNKRCLSELPKGLDAKWLNSTLKTLDVDAKRFNIYPVLPNQHGDFCEQKALFVDNGIPEELKDEVFQRVSLDYKGILLHKDMDAEVFSVNSLRGTSDFAHDLNEKIAPRKSSCYGNYFYGTYHSYPQDDLEQVALSLLNLLPKDEGSESAKNQHALQSVTQSILGNDNMPNVSYVNCNEAELWKESNGIIANMLAKKIKDDDTIDSLRTRIGETGEQELFETLNKYYKCLLALGINHDGFSVFPNQKGIFCSISTLKKEDGTIPEIIKDIIALLVSEGEEYRFLLADKRCYIQPEQSLDCSSAFKLVDDKVSESYENPQNWQDKDYCEAVHKLLEEWKDERDFSPNNFPKTFPKKDTILLNVVWTPEKRKSLGKIGNILSEEDLENLVANLGEIKNLIQGRKSRVKPETPDRSEEPIEPTDVNPEEEEKSDEKKTDGRTPIERLFNLPHRPHVKICTPDGNCVDYQVKEAQYAGLSDSEAVYYVSEAKRAVVNYFRHKEEKSHLGYTFDEKRIGMNSFSQLYGIYGPDGNEIPLVVHSYLGPEYNDFSLNYYDYLLLRQPGSMLWVLTRTDGLQCIPEYALPVNYITMESKESGAQALARALATVAGECRASISYAYGNNMPCGFKEPRPFHEVPQELTRSVESIKVACQKEIPVIANLYNCEPPIPHKAISGKDYALYLEQTMEEMFDIKPQLAKETIEPDSITTID